MAGACLRAATPPTDPVRGMVAPGGRLTIGPPPRRRTATKAYELATMHTTTASARSHSPARLGDRLGRERAEVRFDRGTRWLYATDASLYQVEPWAWSCRGRSRTSSRSSGSPPRRGCRSREGAHTSLSGQTVGPAVVIDFSKYMNRIGVVDRDAMSVRVEPGVVLNQSQCPPEAARADVRARRLDERPGDARRDDRQQLGGARSLRYGKTVDHVREVDVVLADGTPATFGPLDDRELEMPAPARTADDPSHRPRRRRRGTGRPSERGSRASSGGSAATTSTSSSPACRSVPTAGRDEPWRFNLAKLIVGSEGTLAVLRGAEVGVVPLPAAQGLVILSFATIEARSTAWARSSRPGRRPSRCSTDDPGAGRGTRSSSATRASPRGARPPSWSSTTPTRPRSWPTAPDDWARRFEGVRTSWGPQEPVLEGRQGRLRSAQGRLLDPDGDGRRRQAGRLRRGHGGLPERLPAFYDRFRAIVERHGVEAACYGHADVGPAHPADPQREDARGGRPAAFDPRGLGPGRRVRGGDERRARRRPGAQHLERQISAPRSTPPSRPSSTPSTPTTG